MRSLALSICLAILAADASAQPVAPISVTFSAQNLVDQLDVGRENYNADLCDRLKVQGACNQSNVCAASFAATGQPATGSACTSAEAVAAGVKFYARTSIGLQNFIEVEVVKPLIPLFNEARGIRARETARKKCLNANKATADAICAVFDMAADCDLCDAFK